MDMENIVLDLNGVEDVLLNFTDGEFIIQYDPGEVEEKSITKKGGTMRLGAYEAEIMSGSLVEQLYGKLNVSERHRHRYEFNNAYRGVLTRNGLKISGVSPDGELVEIIEVEDHPWFLGCQFHPEFKSRPTEPHPLFRSFIAASLKEKRSLFPYVVEKETREKNF